MYHFVAFVQYNMTQTYRKGTSCRTTWFWVTVVHSKSKYLKMVSRSILRFISHNYFGFFNTLIAAWRILGKNSVFMRKWMFELLFTPILSPDYQTLRGPHFSLFSFFLFFFVFYRFFTNLLWHYWWYNHISRTQCLISTFLHQNWAKRTVI